MLTCEDCADSDDWFDEDPIRDEDAVPPPHAPEETHHSAAAFLLELIAAWGRAARFASASSKEKCQPAAQGFHKPEP
jgi:hypothetical protein